MRKFIFFISILVLLLGIPAVVKAKPPEELGPLATIQYVNSQINILRTELMTYVDEKIGGGGGGEDFYIPENWDSFACAYCSEMGDLMGPKIKIRTPPFEIDKPETFCNWHGVSIGANVEARAIAYLPVNTNEEPSTVLGYAKGQCSSFPGGIVFDKFVENVEFPSTGIIPVHIWFDWMGIKKKTWVYVTIVESPPGS